MAELQATLDECLAAPSDDDIDNWDQETLDEMWEDLAFELGVETSPPIRSLAL